MVPIFATFFSIKPISPQPNIDLYPAETNLWWYLVDQPTTNIGVAMKNPYSNGYHDITWISCHGFNGLQGFNGHDVHYDPSRPACPNGREVEGAPLTQQEDTSVVPGEKHGFLDVFLGRYGEFNQQKCDTNCEHMKEFNRTTLDNRG